MLQCCHLWEQGTAPGRRCTARAPPVLLMPTGCLGMCLLCLLPQRPHPVIAAAEPLLLLSRGRRRFLCSPPPLSAIRHPHAYSTQIESTAGLAFPLRCYSTHPSAPNLLRSLP